MKRSLLLMLVAVSMACGFVSCQKPAESQVKEKPMFCTWYTYTEKEDFDSICRSFSELGIDGIVLKAGTAENYRKTVPVAKKHGLTVYAWVWTLNNPIIAAEHPEWLSVNRDGYSIADSMAYVPYYKFLSPIIPEARQEICKQIDEISKVEGIEAISIDYHRLVDVVLPTTLWPNYGIVQDREYPQWDYGYHPEMIKAFKEKHGYDPREQEDPSKDEKWLKFRCDMVSEVANLVAETVHANGLLMAASPFPTPKMSARMVRQYWGDWNLDIVFPMVYHNFYTEDASFVADCTIENARDKKETTTLYAGLWGSNNNELFESMDAAFNNGAQGVSFYTAEYIVDPEIRKQFKAYADSVRAVRKANGGVMKATYPTVADPDPFKHEGVMKLIESRMQKLIAEAKGTEELAPLALSEYTLKEEHDVTKRYEITDANSKKTFDVYFYFYGDILSGWNVYLKK